MLFFLLPNVNIYIYKSIDCVYTDKPPDIFISNSLSTYLFEIKNKIKGFEHEWDFFKKYTNPYEFINTLIPCKNKCVSKYKPLSRSYFKMIEILRFFFFDYTVNITNQILFPNKTSIRTFHLAEGPGGFIEAFVNLRKNKNDIYVGMTIIDDKKSQQTEERSSKIFDSNIPGWKKSDHFIKSNPNVHIEVGADGTGNILSMENFIHCRELYGSSMDFITGDGGFDFSSDFNLQETNITSLLFAQMCYAVCLQKQGGHFVLKIFDTFMEHSLDILYILSSLYKKVYIVKPQTSRYANSEKYVVCKHFIASNDSHIFPYIKNAFQKMLQHNPTHPATNDQTFPTALPPSELVVGLQAKLAYPNHVMDRVQPYISRFLNIHISSFFIYRLEEYNAIFGQQQIENICQTIILIETKNKNGKGTFIPISTHSVSERSPQLAPFGNGVPVKPSGWSEPRSELKSGVADGELWHQDSDGTQLLTQKVTEGSNLDHLRRSEWCQPNTRGSEATYGVCSEDNFYTKNKCFEHNSKFENLLKIHVQKCIQWCIDHDIPYHF